MDLEGEEKLLEVDRGEVLRHGGEENRYEELRLLEEGETCHPLLCVPRPLRLSLAGELVIRHLEAHQGEALLVFQT